MKIFFYKIKLYLALTIFMTVFLSTNVFAEWLNIEDKGMIIWVNDDKVTFPRDGWVIIDDDKDGVGYYYYFDKDGKLLLDTITPDYNIVNWQGQRIKEDGTPLTVAMGSHVKEGEKAAEDFELPQLEEQIENSRGNISEGTINLKQEEETMGPDMHLSQNQQDNGYILGPNVKLNKKEQYQFDTELSRDVKKYVTTSHSFAKSVNGTIYTKVKWDSCMALKGDGANVVFENPKNNFNRIRGRVATHYFTSTDRTTVCSISIYDADTEEELYTFNDFNYNAGASFDVRFYRSVNRLRFELNISGQYTTRVVYMREFRYSFDKDYYAEELEEKQMEAEIESAYLEGANISIATESDAIHDEETTEESANDNIAGPGFDNRLKVASVSVISGPDGSIIRSMIPGR